MDQSTDPWVNSPYTDTKDYTRTLGVDPHSTVEVDTGTGTPQRWTGETWNDHVTTTLRRGEDVTHSVTRVIPDPGLGLGDIDL